MHLNALINAFRCLFVSFVEVKNNYELCGRVMYAKRLARAFSYTQQHVEKKIRQKMK